MTVTGLAIAAGWVADQAFGEPPPAVHPVAGFGTAMRAVEQRLYAPTRRAGVAHAAIGVGAAITVGLVAERIVGRRAAVCAATALCTAGRMLARETHAVLDLVDDGDLSAARSRLGGLVGRETTTLDEPAVVRAAVETMAENTVDAVIAPLWWAAVAGTPGVLAHRAVNTLDAMVGHRNARYEQFGWAAARTDDVANFVPARLAALAVATLTPRRAANIWRVVRRDAPRHPSPNGGVIEAATAAAIGVSLGGHNTYGDSVEDRGVLGDGPAPTTSDARRAIRLLTGTGALVALAIGILR